MTVTTDYYVRIRSSEISDGVYPSFAESYFGGCEKYFPTEALAQQYLNSFEDWEQPMLEIVPFEYDPELIPF